MEGGRPAGLHLYRAGRFETIRALRFRVNQGGKGAQTRLFWGISVSKADDIFWREFGVILMALTHSP